MNSYEHPPSNQPDIGMFIVKLVLVSILALVLLIFIVGVVVGAIVVFGLLG